MNRHLLHFALEYRDRGWSVIPVDGKRPPLLWGRFRKQRPSIGLLKKWFSGNQSHNLAVITGRLSGLVVIDCDTVEDTLWWQKNYPHTPLTVITGRGGMHFYYRYPESIVGNPTRIFGRKIDVRAEGGLVVAPPSIHPETSRTYRWEPWDYYALSEIPVFQIAWLGTCEASRPTGPTTKTFYRPVRNGLAYIRHIMAESGNGGHNATFRAACKLRDSGLSVDQGLQALRVWNMTNAKPPWTDKELAHKIHDAYRHRSP